MSHLCHPHCQCCSSSPDHWAGVCFLPAPSCVCYTPLFVGLFIHIFQLIMLMFPLLHLFFFFSRTLHSSSGHPHVKYCHCLFQSCFNVCFFGLFFRPSCWPPQLHWPMPLIFHFADFLKHVQLLVFTLFYVTQFGLFKSVFVSVCLSTVGHSIAWACVVFFLLVLLFF